MISSSITPSLNKNKHTNDISDPTAQLAMKYKETLAVAVQKEHILERIKADYRMIRLMLSLLRLRR